MAVIIPFANKIVPFSITPFVTVWMVAPRNATAWDWGGTVIRTCALAEVGDNRGTATAAIATTRVIAVTLPARDK
jgi:hypothetical protein